MPDGIKGKKQNKGEWAELYVMLKLLGEGKLYAANSLLQKKQKHYLDVIKVIREEAETGVVDYVIDDNNKTVSVVRQKDNVVLSVASMDDYNRHANILFADIQKKTGRSVEAPEKVCEHIVDICEKEGE